MVARRKHRDNHQKMTSFKVSICHSYLLLGNKLPQIWWLKVKSLIVSQFLKVRNLEVA